jgi:hypothetical protein
MKKSYQWILNLLVKRISAWLGVVMKMQLVFLNLYFRNTVTVTINDIYRV